MRRAGMFGGASPWLGQMLPAPGAPVATGGGSDDPKVKALCQLADRYGTGTLNQDTAEFVADAMASALEGFPSARRDAIVRRTMYICPEFATLWDTIYSMTGHPPSEPRPEPDPDAEPEPPFEPEAEPVPTGVIAEICVECPDGSFSMMPTDLANLKNCTQVDRSKCEPEKPPPPPPPPPGRPTPTDYPEYQERKCYACGPEDFRMLTVGEAQAQMCTLTNPDNCQPTPEPTPTSRVTPRMPPGAVTQPTPPPMPTRAPTGTERVARQTQPQVQPGRQPVASEDPYRWGRDVQEAGTGRYQWGRDAKPAAQDRFATGQEIAREAEQRSAGCPPGQWWQGGRCRGGIDYEALARYGSMIPGGQTAAPTGTSITPTVMPSPVASIAGPLEGRPVRIANLGRAFFGASF